MKASGASEAKDLHLQDDSPVPLSRDRENQCERSPLMSGSGVKGSDIHLTFSGQKERNTLQGCGNFLVLLAAGR